MGVEILTGGVTAGVVMTLFGQSQRDTQRPIGPIISYWNVRTMVEATRVGQVHVAMEMKEYGTEVLGISEARLGHIHCTWERGCWSDGERKTTTTWRRTEEKKQNTAGWKRWEVAKALAWDRRCWSDRVMHAPTGMRDIMMMMTTQK